MLESRTTAPKILVIDDSKTILISVKMTLMRGGYEVVTLESALNATAVIRAERPDLLLLDLSMPEVDGEDLLNIIRRFNILPTMKVVLHSDQEAHILQDVVTYAGADGFIQKTSPEKLLALVDGWFSDIVWTEG